MRKKLYFLVCFVSVFFLCSTVEGGTPIDVNNFSFEFDSNDGSQILCHMGIDGVLAWEQSGSAWVGVDPYCLGDANYDPCAIPENICYSWECYTDDHQGCHCWPATHGVVWSYIQATDRTYLYQELDPNDPNARIASGRKYTLTYDSMSEIYQGVLDFLSAHAGFFYGRGDANHVDIVSTSYVLPVWIGDFEEWKHEWVTNLTLEWVCPPGHPDINEVLGIKFWTPSPAGSVRAYIQVDNVRLEWSWATEAYNPTPADGADFVSRETELSWIPGLWADTSSGGHIIYFGTDWDDVNDRSRSGGSNEGVLDTNSFDPGTLELGQTYYWTVTEVNDAYVHVEGIPDPPWLGEIWSFTVEGRAANPRPEDRSTEASLYSVLKWDPGTDSEEHDVYFGTDFEEVNEADDSDVNVFKCTQSPNSYDPGILDLGQTYYWRIDEVRNSGADMIKGYVWSFTVAEYFMIDDMESYVAYVNDIFDTWIPGGTAVIGLKTSEDDANYVLEEEGNSMEYRFRNQYSPYYGETSRSFDPAEDWTVSGFRALTLYFRADMGNPPVVAQPMYVFVSDGVETGTVEYDDPNDLIRGRAGWQEWNIDLQEFADAGVDLSNVTELGIKIGDGTSTGEGYVYFDDISLYPRRCVVEEAAGSFTNDCDVDIDDLAVLASDWLIMGIGNITGIVPSTTGLFGHWTMNDNTNTSEVLDSSGNGNHGVLYDDVGGGGDLVEGDTDDHSTSPGAVDDYGLDFDGEDDFVKLPALDVNSNTITIAAWVKREPEGHAYDGIVMSSNNYDPDNEIPGPNYTAGLQFGSDTTDWSANYELSFMWTGYSWEWHTGLFVPPGEWTFTALTVAPEVATLYLYDGMFLEAARKYDTYEPLPWNTSFHIADQMQFGPPSESERFFPGAVDDVHIYNRTLSAEEILYLALQGPGSWYVPLESWRANANEDDVVNLADYAIMADSWLTEVLWP